MAAKVTERWVTDTLVRHFEDNTMWDGERWKAAIRRARSVGISHEWIGAWAGMCGPGGLDAFSDEVARITKLKD